MTKEFKKIIKLLEKKVDIENTLSQFQHHQDEFETTFGLPFKEEMIELMLFLFENKMWYAQSPLSKIKIVSTKNNLVQHIPKMIGSLKKLECLLLNGNKIKEIPTEIQELEDLHILSLNDNLMEHIPKEIFELKRLRGLYFNHNKIKEIPTAIKELKKIMYLDFKNNKIKEIPTEITTLKKLISLHLANNKIKEIPTEIIEGIAKLKDFKVLDLSDNPIENIDEIKSLLPNCTIIF